MDKPPVTHEARCLIILAGGVLERWIESRARGIAENRAAIEIAPEDVRKAAVEFLKEELSTLPRLIEHAIDDYEHASNKAA